MNILMVTNTYLPHIGGVARSVSLFRDEYRRCGHRVVVIAPQYDGPSMDENDIVRIPSIRKFNGSDFSLEVPVPGILLSTLSGFRPDIVHSHHPFLLGGSALRLARSNGIPLVFTFHTRWEHYAHYVWNDSAWFKNFVSALAVGYAGLADQIFSPSAGIANFLRLNRVRTPIAVVPTGIDLKKWISGDGASFRRTAGIGPAALVIGTMSRLAVEKNLAFLALAVARFLRRSPRAVFLVVGAGPEIQTLRGIFAAEGLSGRVCYAGSRIGAALSDAVHAMNLFVFASKSETQGLVLAEAMGAGVPVVSLDAPGSREIVSDGKNGRLVSAEDPALFAEAMEWAVSRNRWKKASMRAQCLATAARYSIQKSAARALHLYRKVIEKKSERLTGPARALGELRAEWFLVQNLALAAASAQGSPKEFREAAI